MAEVLLEQRHDKVAVLTMNRPERKNALDAALVEALGDAFERLDEDSAARCVVLTGAGGAFCAGADLKNALGNPDALAQAGDALARYHRIVRAMTGLSKPVIAAVDGPAVGFGCDLALACDLRVLSERAYLQEKFVRIGLIPDGGGSFWLPRLIGMGRALELMMTGDRIDADRAEVLGLANHVVAHHDLEGRALELATRLADGPPLAMAAIKRVVRQGLEGGIDDALAREREAQLRCLASSDFLEGVGAWMQKREPKFRGE